MKVLIQAMFAAAVLTAAVPARGGQVAFELPVVQLEVPEPGPRAYSAGMGFGSGVAMSLAEDGQGERAFDGASTTQLRFDLVPSDRLALGLVLKPLHDSQGAETGSYVAARLKVLLRSAQGRPGSWDTAVVLSAGSGSVEDSSGGPDAGVTRIYTAHTSSRTAMLVFGRHVGEHSLLFGGPVYSTMNYTADVERWTTRYGDWVAGGCALFFCWTGHREVFLDYDASHVSGSPSAMGVSLGYAYRRSRGEFATQLAFMRVEDGDVADTRAMFMAGIDFFLGRPRR